MIDDIIKLFKPRNPDAEKRDFGSVLIIGGSYGMIGSISMAANAALRSGAGLVTILAPSCGYEILQTLVPEAMILENNDEKYLSNLPDITNFTTIAVGPGLGKNNATVSFIDLLLQLNRPLIIDADALNIIAENNWQSRIPKESIITPHKREFERLFGKNDIHTTHDNKALELGIYIVLKGRNTRIVFPDKSVYINNTGNPGMAKGGSGDVLTGIIAGLSARYHDPAKAVVMGVYLHGLAGDIAAEKYNQESMTASDIISCLADVFKKVALMKNQDTM